MWENQDVNLTLFDRYLQTKRCHFSLTIMKTRFKTNTMTASPSLKRKLKRNTANENRPTEVLDGMIKTPKTKSRAEVVTPLRDDIICSQHFDSQTDVGWDCNSPDTLRHIQRMSNRDGNSSDLDIVMKLIIDEEPNQRVRNSQSPPLLGVWKHSKELNLGLKHQQQHRTGKRRGRMRNQSASDSMVSRELLQKLTLALEKCPDSEPICDEMDSEICSRLPISDGPTTEERLKPHDSSHDLFDSINFQRTLADEKIKRPDPEQEAVTLSETSWSDEELFEDNSFIIKATQYPQDILKTAGSPVFVCNKRKLSGDGNLGNIKSPRYVAHTSTGLVFQDSKLGLISSKDMENQQVKNVANKPPTGKSVSVTGQKKHLLSSKNQIGAGTNTVINDTYKSSNSLSRKGGNTRYGKDVLGQESNIINHGSMQSVQSSTRLQQCNPTNTHNTYSLTKVNGSDSSGMNNSGTVRTNSASSFRANTGSLFRKHSSFPGPEKIGSNPSQPNPGPSGQRFVSGSAQNSMPETNESQYCDNKSSLMRRAHSFDATFNTSNSAGAINQSDTGGACVQYRYRQTYPVSSRQNSGVMDKHYGDSVSAGIAKTGKFQKNQVQNKNKVTMDTGIKLDREVVSKNFDNQKNPPSNKDNSSKESGKKPDLKLIEETTDTCTRQSFNTSLTDELLCQLAEPDEILESQIDQVNKHRSDCADVDTDIVLSKTKNMDSKPFENFSKLKASLSHNALKSDSTQFKGYSFKPSQQVKVIAKMSASCMKKQQGQSNSTTSEKKPSQAKEGPVPVADSEDLFLSDDDDALTEPQILAMLDEAEWMATQQSEKDYGKIKKGNSSEDNPKDPKYQLTSSGQLPGSQEGPQDCSSQGQQVAGSQGTSGSQLQCTPEEIEKKRIEAIKRRQEKAAKKTSLSLRKR